MALSNQGSAQLLCLLPPQHSQLTLCDKSHTASERGGNPPVVWGPWLSLLLLGVKLGPFPLLYVVGKWFPRSLAPEHHSKDHFPCRAVCPWSLLNLEAVLSSVTWYGLESLEQGSLGRVGGGEVPFIWKSCQCLSPCLTRAVEVHRFAFCLSLSLCGSLSLCVSISLFLVCVCVMEGTRREKWC